MGYSTDLNDAQWALIAAIVPPQEGPGRFSKGRSLTINWVENIQTALSSELLDL
jgi:hypothetical protein